MKNAGLITLTVLVLLPGCGPQRPAAGSPDTAHLDNTFREAERVLYRLLLPNTMARTEPRTDAEVLHLLGRFRRLSRVFEEHPGVSVPFLSAKVSTTPAGQQDPAVCALQLLFEIDSPTARRAIRNAQKHPHEVVSRTAVAMLRHRQGLLYGFRKIEQMEHTPLTAKRPKDLAWGNTHDGIRMATWMSPGRPLVFCVIKNGTDTPVSIDAGYGGIGWWEWTRVLFRRGPDADWATAPCRQEWARLGAYQPRARTLDAGAEFLRDNREWTFAVDLRDYAFPSGIRGRLELRIEHRGISGAVMMVDAKTLREFQEGAPGT